MSYLLPAKQGEAKADEAAAAAAACLANEYAGNYAANRLPGQEFFGPEEAISSLADFGKESGKFLAETIAEGSLNNASIYFADKGVVKSAVLATRGERYLKLYGEVGLVIGAGEDLGDAIDSAIYTARDSNCCL